jgi:hypothetical protein
MTEILGGLTGKGKSWVFQIPAGGVSDDED